MPGDPVSQLSAVSPYLFAFRDFRAIKGVCNYCYLTYVQLVKLMGWPATPTDKENSRHLFINQLPIKSSRNFRYS